MDWKEFFKPSLKRIIITIIILVLLCLILFLPIIPIRSLCLLCETCKCPNIIYQSPHLVVSSYIGIAFGDINDAAGSLITAMVISGITVVIIFFIISYILAYVFTRKYQ